MKIATCHLVVLAATVSGVGSPPDAQAAVQEERTMQRLVLPKLGEPMTTVVEIESLAATATASAGRFGVQQMAGFGPGWGGDAQLFWGAPAPAGDGPRLTLRFELPQAGAYDLVLFHTVAPDFGRFTLFLDGSPSSDVDGYHSSVAISRSVLGRHQLAAGAHELALRVTGKNDSSSGYFVGLDRLELNAADGGAGPAQPAIKMRPSLLPTPSMPAAPSPPAPPAPKQRAQREILLLLPGVEAEEMTVKWADGNRTIQEMSGFQGRWGGGRQLLWNPPSFHARLVLSFTVPATAARAVVPILYYTQAPDYGLVILRLGGRRVALIDGYAPAVMRTRIELPSMTLPVPDAGKADDITLEFEVYNHDERSSNTLVGIDRIEFRPVSRSERTLTPEAGICAAGGRHVAAGNEPYILPRAPYGYTFGRWCLKCGASFFRRHAADHTPQHGGRCRLDPQLLPAATALMHAGNGSFDKLIPLADPDALPPYFYWCRNCKAIYTSAVKVLPGVDACPYPDQTQHTPYKNDRFAIARTGPSGRYRVCMKCAILYSVNDWAPTISGGDASDCPALRDEHSGKTGPHEPVPGEFYDVVNINEAWDAIWARCHKCGVLYYVADFPDSFGRCTAGGAHEPSHAAIYPLVRKPDVKAQESWFECFKCSSLYFAPEGNVNAGACPAGGQHELKTPFKPGEQHQVLPGKKPLAGGEKWYRCEKCGSLFHGGGAGTS